MKKVFLALLIVVLVPTMLFASGTTEAKSDVITIRIGHAQNEQGDWHKGLEVFKSEVEKLSNGKMNVEIYANETLGSEIDNITAIQQGTVEGVITGDSMTNWTPYAALVAMPYSVKDFDGLIACATDPEIGGVIEKAVIEKVKLHPIGFFIRSARELTSSKKVSSIADLKGLKVRVPNNPIHLAMWNAFGASATPIAFSETFSALQNGTVDAQENPYSNIISANIFEVNKYLMLTDHVFSWIYVTLGENFWQSLTPEQQKIISDAAAKMEERQWDDFRNIVAEQEAQLREKMEFVQIDKAPFIAIAKEVMKDKLAAEVYDVYLKMLAK